MNKSLILALSATLLTGCANTSFFSATEPTKESVAASPVGQSYQDVQYYASDFDSNGLLRKFEDYDFNQESAPCTVLENPLAIQPHPTLDFDEGLVKVYKEGKVGIFICRPVTEQGDRYRQLRLFLAASAYDCKTRAGKFYTYASKAREKYEQMCRPQYWLNENETVIDREYQQNFQDDQMGVLRLTAK
jgi:hypothetical protein